MPRSAEHPAPAASQGGHDFLRETPTMQSTNPSRRRLLGGWLAALYGWLLPGGEAVQATDRVPEDDIVVVTLHFTRDNGELSSTGVHEHTKIEVTGN